MSNPAAPIIVNPEKVQEVEVPKNEIFEGAKFNVSTGDSPLTKPKTESSHVLILGGGVSGLMVAWMLLDKGFRVTILAKEWARTWVSANPESLLRLQVPCGRCLPEGVA